jgi:hypothetical protein
MYVFVKCTAKRFDLLLENLSQKFLSYFIIIRLSVRSSIFEQPSIFYKIKKSSGSSPSIHLFPTVAKSGEGVFSEVIGLRLNCWT